MKINGSHFLPFSLPINLLRRISTIESSLNFCFRASVSRWNSEWLSSTLPSISEIGLLAELSLSSPCFFVVTDSSRLSNTWIWGVNTSPFSFLLIHGAYGFFSTLFMSNSLNRSWSNSGSIYGGSTNG